MHPEIHLVSNSHRRKNAPYGDLSRLVGWQRAGEACAEIAGWDGYEPSPLLTWASLAAASGVASIRCKYEGGRFGIGSFKALGGAYAVLRALEEQLVDVAQADQAARLAGMTVATASDGNHGLSVAWGARRAGCACVVFLHQHVSDERQRLIESMGATVRRVEGNYDDSTAEADRAARAEGWMLVPDTAPQYSENPLRVMAGYGVMVQEMEQQYAGMPLPTHIFLQAGCGGLAAAVCGLLREVGNGEDAPAIVIVEPDKAACLFESVRAGKPVRVEGDLDTIMSGLSVGEASNVAWPVLMHGADFFMTITDDTALCAMQHFARGFAGEQPVEIGDSGVAGIAGFLAANQDAAARQRLKLGPDSHVLVIATEGPVDRTSYNRLIATPVPDISLVGAVQHIGELAK